MHGNTIIIRTINKDSEWCDKDIIMLHVCFQLLEDYKENEMHLIEWKWSVKQQEIEKEINTLYDWWQLRKTKNDPVDMDREEQEEDNIYLARLIKIRTYLWT